MYKKIAPIALAAAFLFAASVASAQTAPSIPSASPHSTPTTFSTSTYVAPSMPLSDVTVGDVSVVSQNGRTFTLSFPISNNTTLVEPSITYVIHLLSVSSATSSAIIDEEASGDFFTLDKNSTATKTATFVIPDSLPSGNYVFLVEAGNNAGLSLASNYSAPFFLPRSDSPVLEIVPNTCNLSVSGQPHKSGIVIASLDAPITETCQVLSGYPATTSVSLQFETRLHNLFGAAATATAATATPVTLSPGLNTISFAIPKGATPNDYYLTVRLASADGKTLSNRVGWTYFLEGLSGQIMSAVFNQTSYKTGDTAGLLVTSLLYELGSKAAAATGTLAVSVSDGSGHLCAATTSQPASLTLPQSVFSFEITKDCSNPSAHIVLSAPDQNGNIVVLDVRDFNVITPSSNASALWLILGGILVLLVIFFLARAARSRKMPSAAPIAVLAAGFLAISFFAGAHRASALNCWPNPVDATGGKGLGANNSSYSGFNFCDSSEDPFYIDDLAGGNQANNFYWSGRTVSYYGHPGGVVAWPKGNVNGNIFIFADDNGQYTFKVAYLGGYSVWTIQVVNTGGNLNPPYGTPGTVSWNSVGASNCDIRQDGVMLKSGAGTGGTISTNPITQTSVVNISCYGWPPGSSINVTLIPQNPPTANIGAGNAQVPFGGATNVFWSSTSTYSCVVSKGGGIHSISVNGTQTYTNPALPAGGPTLSEGSGISVSLAPNTSVIDQGFITTTDYNTPSWLSSFGQYGSGNPSNLSLAASNYVGLALDTAGNIYLADVGNDRIKKFSASGTYLSQFGTSSCTTFGGNGPNNNSCISQQSNGSGNGQLDTPKGVAVDSSGKVYVADSNNNRVEVFDASGNYLGQSGSASGTAFSNPRGVAVPASGGALYVSDSNNNRIVELDTTKAGGWGYMSQFGSSGNGNGQFSNLNSSQIAVDSSGNVYVTDPNNYRVEKFGVNGNYLLKLGSQGNGNGQFSNLNSSKMTLNAAGTAVYVTDPNNYRVEEFDALGNYLAKFGAQGNNNGQFSNLNSSEIAFGAPASIYVTDPNNYRVEIFSATSGAYAGKFGSQGSGNGQFSNLNSSVMAVGPTNGNVYVSDPNNYRVEIFSASGAYLNSFGGQGSSNGKFSNLNSSDIAIDPSSGNVYVSDPNNYRVEIFDANGNYLNKFGSSGNGNGKFSNLNSSQIAVDSYGYVYVADPNNYRVEVFDKSGNYVAQFGSSGNGNGQFSNLNSSVGAVDPSLSGSSYTNGGVFITDPNNYRVERFGPNSYGVLHVWGSNGSGNGQFKSPAGLALDGAGNVWVADTNNSRVQEFSSSGAYLNQFGSSGSGNGQFNGPAEIAFDSSGNIYVSDQNNARVQKFNSAGTYLGKFGTSTGSGAGQFGSQYGPSGVAVAGNGNVIVADPTNNRVETFQPFTVSTNYYNTGSTSTGPVLGDTEYDLSCIGTGGGFVATSSVVVHVSPGVFLTAPASVNQGDPVHLSWTSEGVSQCFASGDWTGDNPSTGEVATTSADYAVTTSNTYYYPLNFYITCLSPSGLLTNSSAHTNEVPMCTNLVKANVSVANDCKNASVALSWSASTDGVDGLYYNVFEDDPGNFIASTTASSMTIGSIPVYATATHHTFYVEAVNGTSTDAGTTTASVDVTIPAQDPSCTPGAEGTATTSCAATQNGVGTTTVYINRQMNWTAQLSSSTAIVNSVVWSGDNVPSTQTSNLTLPWIYTTIGSKTIYATTTYNGGKVAACTATINVVSAGGSGGEI